MTIMGSVHERAQSLQGVNVFLVGMMGAGKSTVGRDLAKRLGYQFFDTDQLVEQVSGQSIPDLLTQQGEMAFRDWETEVLAQLSSFTRLVVATGGGIVKRSLNWSYLHHGVVVWLDVSSEGLLARLHADPTPRPLLASVDPQATLESLLTERRPLYAQADVHVQVTPPVLNETVVEWVIERVLRRLRTEPF